MAEFKINIGDPKSKKTIQKDAAEDVAKQLVGKRIGDSFKGEILDLPGYEFEITGGSDSSGFPMRKDVQGISRKKILIVKGIGIRKNRDGRKVRRSVAGNTVFENTAQINVKVVKAGKTPLFEEPKEEVAEQETAKAPKEEAKSEAPKEESK